MINYTVSDMLTRLRNAIRVKKTKVTIRSTNITKKITEILKREGYIDESYEALCPPVRFAKRSDGNKKSAKAIGYEVQHKLREVSSSTKTLDQNQSDKITQSRDYRVEPVTQSPIRSLALQKELHLYLRYEGKEMVSVLTHLKTVSRPGVRFYANTAEIPQVLGGLGITILSTSKGILTDAEARSLGVGGEVLCMIW